MSVMRSFGTDGIKNMLLQLKSDAEKKQELQKLALIAQGDIVQDTPAGINRLRSSITTKVKDKNTAVVGTNVEYAKAVEYGHEQSERFLPSKYLQSAKGKQYLGSNDKGVLLKAQFVQGAHMFEKGMQSAEPKMNAEITNWLTTLSDKFKSR